MITGIISSIQRFSINDGPGIRTTVFFKGCPLRCIWCQNPECMSPEPEVMFYSEDARRGYGGRVSADSPLLRKLSRGEYVRPEDAGADCAGLVESYYAGDVVLCGEERTVEDVMAEVERDRAFYEESGGGVTVSGGEPLSQSGFVAELLRMCREKGIHTAIDTSGQAQWEGFQRVLPHTDLFLFDLKVMDPAEHGRQTGVTNELILENLRRLSESRAGLVISIPVVPGFTDRGENVEEIARFLRSLAGEFSVRLLPYHQFSRSKYNALRMPYSMCEISEEEIAQSVRSVRAILSEFSPRVEE